MKNYGTYGLITGQDIGNQDCPRSQTPFENPEHMALIVIIQTDFQTGPCGLQNI